MRLAFIAAALASAIALCEGSTKMVIGYFPNWLYANYPVENIPYKKYTHINYAFAILNNEDNVPSFPDDWAIEAYLPKIVKLAHESQTKVLLSVGGWTGSKRFSPMVASPSSRKKFIDWNINFIQKYDTDGVDIDWEYPGKQAAGCNEFADNDADNFLELLKELRETLDTKFGKDKKEISMAVHVAPFVKNGTPMNDVKNYVPYFDHINLMTYDINGAWAPVTGPNAPFQKKNEEGAPFSFVDSIKQWKAAGVPSNKITAGLAFYGRSMKATVDMTKKDSQFQSAEVGAPKGDSDDAYWNDPYCNKDTGGLSGVWKWTNLRKEGILMDDNVTPANGWQRKWDNISKTPWLFNPSTKQYISYDDPQSLNIKVDHALCEDLAGVMVWDIHQDNGELLDVVNKIHESAPKDCSALLREDYEVKTPIIANQDYNRIVSESQSSVHSSVLASIASDDGIDIYTIETAPAISSPLPSTSAVLSDTISNKISESMNSKACSISGQTKCAKNGVSSEWLTCNINTWVVRECPAGLVCIDTPEGSIYCDTTNNAKKLKAAAVNTGIPADAIVASSLPLSGAFMTPAFTASLTAGAGFNPGFSSAISNSDAVSVPALSPFVSAAYSSVINHASSAVDSFVSKVEPITSVSNPGAAVAVSAAAILSESVEIVDELTTIVLTSVVFETQDVFEG